MSASAQIIKQITIEGYYTSITFELESMDRLGKASLEAWRHAVEDNRRMRCWAPSEPIAV